MSPSTRPSFFRKIGLYVLELPFLSPRNMHYDLDGNPLHEERFSGSIRSPK